MILVVLAVALAATAAPPALELGAPLAPPEQARGGHAHAASDPARGGRAVVVLLITPDLERLGVARVRDLPRFGSWVCIHDHEGAWNDRGDPFWGGLQMDQTFQRTYGPDLIRHYSADGSAGLADEWTEAEQIIVAERAYATRGFGPWPNTRRPCHV